MLLINHPSSFFGPASSKEVAFPLSGFGDVTLSLYIARRRYFIVQICICDNHTKSFQNDW